MRTNIVIDPPLMAGALRASGLATKKQAVEAGLRLLIAARPEAPHPAYAAWLQRRDVLAGEKKTSRAKAAAVRAADADTGRSSEAMKAALDAKYRR